MNMILGLVEAGANITLLAMSTPKHQRSLADFPQHIKSKIDVNIVDVNTNLSVVKGISNLLFSSEPYNAIRFKSKDYAQKLFDILSHTKYDVVQLEGAYLYSYVPLIRKYFKGIISLRAHNVEHEIWRRASTNQHNFFKRWYFNLLANRICKLETDLLSAIDILIPITARDLTSFKEMGYGGMSIVSPTGYNAFEYETNVTEAEHADPSIFHLGGLDWLPNQEGIIWFLQSCWEQILENVPKAKFYIAGRNAPEWFVSKILRFEGVVYCGEVKSSVEFIKSKGVMVVPILSGGGMRIKIVEGMALGKAIVSTHIGAEGIDAKNGTEIMVESEPEQVVSAVTLLLTNARKASDMGRSAHLFAKSNFDNQVLTSKLLEYYCQQVANEVR
jgi:glycosyltransferase involved in cell wall biosynthesis